VRHSASGATLGVGAVGRQVLVRTIGQARPAIVELFVNMLEAPRVDAVARLAVRGGRGGYEVDGALAPDTLDGSLDAAVRHLRHQVTLHLMAARADLRWMHAAAAARGGRAVLLAGPSGCGKSTLVTRLLDYGFDYLGDDLTALDPRTGLLHAVPMSPRRRVHPDRPVSDGELAALPRRVTTVTPDRVCSTPVPVGLVVFPSYADGRVATRPCTPSEVALELLRHSLDPMHDEEVLRATCALAGRWPAIRVWFDHIDSAAAMISRLHEGAASGRP
jgi:hypothetical protein